MPDQVELQPLPTDAPNSGILNRVFYLLTEKAPGWVGLLGFNGTRYTDSGAVASTGNAALHIKPAAGIAAVLCETSAGVHTLFVDDSGAVIGVGLSLGGNLLFVPDATYNIGAAGATRPQDLFLSRDGTVGRNLLLPGTAARITGPFENATRGNRPFFQSNAANGDTNVNAMPSGANTISKFEAYNNATPGSATGIASLEANNTEVRLTAAFAAGAGLPLQVYAGGVKAVDIAITGDVTLPASVYTTFTPGVTQNGARTVSSPVGRYRLFGKQCHMQVRAIVTNAGTAGNIITFTGIPAGVAPLATGISVVQGQFQILRTGVGFRSGAAYFATTTTIAGLADADADALGTVTGGNFALANGDIVSADMMYEIA